MINSELNQFSYFVGCQDLKNSLKPRLTPPWGYLQPPQETRLDCRSAPLRSAPEARSLCSPLTHKTHPINHQGPKKIRLNNLRVVGKAPCAQLARLKIHRATGKNNVDPGAGRCIFGAGADAAQRGGKHSGRGGI